MAFSYQHMEKLVQALNFATTTSNVITSFTLATASAVFCLWSRTNELLNLRTNQIVQNKKDEHQVCHHEAILRERKNTHGVIEAQAHKVHSRDSEPASDVKNHYTKWMSIHEQAIGRRLQDDECVFPHIDEKGSIDPKIPMPKDKHKNG